MNKHKLILFLLLPFFLLSIFISKNFFIESEKSYSDQSFTTESNDNLNEDIISDSLEIIDITYTSFTFSVNYNSKLVSIDMIENVNGNIWLSHLENSTEKDEFFNANYLDYKDKGDFYTVSYIVEDLEVNNDYNILGFSQKNVSNNLTYDELTNHSFATHGHAYIEDGGFKIHDISITDKTAIFSINVQDIDNSFDETSQLKVVLDNENGSILYSNFLYQKDNQYFYKLENLTPNKNYVIYGIQDSGLAIESGDDDPVELISVQGDLDVDDNSFTTSNPAINAYTNDFWLDEESITENSIEFSIQTFNLNLENFNLFFSMNITLGKSDGSSSNVDAEFVGTEEEVESGVLTYKITEESSGVSLSPGETYEVISLNNTGLATWRENNQPDDQIMIVDELGITDNTFTTVLTSYINDLYIVEDEITSSSAQFTIEVIGTGNRDLSESIDITLIEDNLTNIDTSASFVSKIGIYYTYQIDNLKPNVSYEIYSLNNTNLASVSDVSQIDDEILVEDELGVYKNSFVTNSNPYISNFSINYSSVSETEAQFSMELHNVDGLANIKSSINLTMSENKKIINKDAMFVKNQGDIYTYELSDLKPYTEYNIIYLNNTNLAVSSGDNPIEEQINIKEELNDNDYEFETLANPYIIEDSFKISKITEESVEFQFAVFDNNVNYFDEEEPLTVKMNDSYGFNTTAEFVSKSEYGDNKIITYRIDNLDPGKEYSIYSILDSELALFYPSSSLEDEILIEDELNYHDNTFVTQAIAYINEDGFAIEDYTQETVTFSIDVTDTNDSFDEENGLDIKFNNNDDIYHADYLSRENTKYSFFIEGLAPKTRYEFYSIINSGLATTADGGVDSEILIVDELGIKNNSFLTSGYSYISKNSVEIIEDSITKNSLKFSFSVKNSSGYVAPENINVTLENLDIQYYRDFEAYLINSENDVYTYQIDNLNSLTNYQIYSLNDTNLASSSNGYIDDEIILEEELNQTINFVTLASPYIENKGFQIVDVGDTYVEFDINVTDVDNQFIPRDIIGVKMDNQNGDIYNASYLSQRSNSYRYIINDLNVGEDYTIYSLINSNLATESPTNSIDDEIVLIDELNLDEEDLIFTTSVETISIDDAYRWIFFPLIMILVIIIFGVAIRYSISKKNYLE